MAQLLGGVETAVGVWQEEVWRGVSDLRAMHVSLAQPAHEWLYDCRSAALKRHYSRVRIWASVLSVWVRNGGVRLRVDALEGVGCRRACRGHADALATFGSLARNMPG